MATMVLAGLAVIMFGGMGALAAAMSLLVDFERFTEVIRQIDNFVTVVKLPP